MLVLCGGSSEGGILRKTCIRSRSITSFFHRVAAVVLAEIQGFCLFTPAAVVEQQ